MSLKENDKIIRFVQANAGRAIRFTGVAQKPTGTIIGYMLDDSTGIISILVHMDISNRRAVSGCWQGHNFILNRDSIVFVVKENEINNAAYYQWFYYNRDRYEFVIYNKNEIETLIKQLEI